MRFTNRIKTEVELLHENELRAKYEEDRRIVARSLKKHATRIAHFKRLNFANVDEMIDKCLLSSASGEEFLRNIIEKTMAETRAEFTPAEAARRFDNASEYSHDQVLNSVKMYSPHFVNYGVINFYSHMYKGEDAPAQQPQPSTSADKTAPLPIMCTQANDSK